MSDYLNRMAAAESRRFSIQREHERDRIQKGVLVMLVLVAALLAAAVFS
jgi:hypothetical protein